MPDEATIGQRFVKQFPLASRYPDDPDKAALKEKQVARTIDFFASFIPKNKEELALEAAVTLIPFGQVAKAGIKGTKKIAKEVFPRVKKEVLEYISNPKYQELLAGYENKPDAVTKVWEEGVGWVNARLGPGSTPTKIQKKAAAERVKRYKKRVEEADMDFEPELPSTVKPGEESIAQTRYATNTAVMNKKYLGGKFGHLNKESIEDAWREELIHLATKGNSDMPPGMLEAISLRQLVPGRDRMPKFLKGYVDPYDVKKVDITPEGNKVSSRYWKEGGDVNQTAMKELEQEHIDYYYKPTETYAKLTKAKIRAGLKPGEKVGDVYPEKMSSTDFEALKALYKPQQLKGMIKELPAAIPAMSLMDDLYGEKK